VSTLPAPGAALVATLRAARAGDADRIAEIHLTARRTAMPWLARPHTDEETRTWVRGVLVPSGAVTVAERQGQVAGYTAVTDGWLEHLYVDPAAQGRGIGSALFAHAQALQPRGFRFWVFQRNTPALAFYARHGCVEVRRTTGEDNAEREPDVCLRWAPPA
jgi:ribosomal protein S18 acetylase RimI-like enzyme